MTKRKKQPEPPAGLASVLETLKEQNPTLKTADEIESPIRKGGPFIGRLSSGRGRVIRADDESYSITSDKPLTAGEEALAVKHGFDDESPNGTMFIADKKTMREANGDINHVAHVLTGKDAGRGR